MISRLRYTLREMWASLTRNLTLTVAAVITSMVSLFLFGMTLLIQQAFDNQLSQWTGGVKMIVYVNNGAPDTAIATIEQALKSRPEIIKNVQYCSVDCSLAQAQKLFAADPESLKFLSASNIPSYFAVEPVDKQSIVQLLSIRDSFVALPGVRSAAMTARRSSIVLRALVVIAAFPKSVHG
jgi:cell division transport system permease protein